eukprot:441361-Amphidinium_carterae.1
MVLLSMIEPKSYVTVEPVDRKVADKARKYRSLFYEQIKDIIKDDVEEEEEVQLDLVDCRVAQIEAWQQCSS